MYELGEALADGNLVASIVVLIILIVLLVCVHGSSKDTQRMLDEYNEPDE